jgi:hypothetical protein
MEPTDKAPVSPSIPPAEKTPSVHWWYVEKLAFPIIVAVVASLLTFFWFAYNGRERELKYTLVSNSGLFQRPEMPGKDVKLVVDNRAIENISTINISLSNPTDQDYENLPIEISFTSNDGNPARLIFASSTSWPGGLSLPPQTQATTTPTTLVQYTYNLSIVNRRDPVVWSGIYTFEGAKAPSVKVDLMKKGLFATPTQASGPWWQDYMFFLPVALIAATSVLVIANIRSNQKSSSKPATLFREAVYDAAFVAGMAAGKSREQMRRAGQVFAGKLNESAPGTTKAKE